MDITPIHFVPYVDFAGIVPLINRSDSAVDKCNTCSSYTEFLDENKDPEDIPPFTGEVIIHKPLIFSTYLETLGKATIAR